MPKPAAWIPWLFGTLLIVLGTARAGPFPGDDAWMVVKIFAAALALLVVTAIQLLRSNERFGCALLLLAGLQVLYCLNCIVAALGGYM